MKPLSEVAPGLLVIQIPVQAVCYLNQEEQILPTQLLLAPKDL